MKIPFSFIILALMAIMSCKSAELAYTPSAAAETLPVQGRQGWQIGQVIRYGDFSTDKVRRGWTKGYDLPFVVRFQGAKEKLSYTQYGPGGRQVEVACVSRFSSAELPLIRDYFSLPLNHQNYFAGTIVPADGPNNWDFILYNPDGDFLRKQATTGFLKNGTEQITIQPIRGLDRQARWMKNMTVHGHEFQLNGRVIAAVSTVNKGTVWMDRNLDEQLKTIIAAVATGLLLRTDVEETTAS